MDIDLKQLFDCMSLPTEICISDSKFSFSPKDRDIASSILPSDYTFDDLKCDDVDDALGKILVILDYIPCIFQESIYIDITVRHMKYLKNFARKLLKAEKQGHLANFIGAQHVCELVLSNNTIFFQYLVVATALVTKNVFPIWVDYSKERKTISQILMEIGWTDRPVLFIGEEFDMVYKLDNCLQIVGEFRSIGKSNVGVVWVILSGSSPHLQDLVYCKGYIKDLQTKFPGYAGTCSIDHECFRIQNL